MRAIRCGLLLVAAVGVGVGAAPPGAEHEPAEVPRPFLLGASFPLETVVSFPAALLHWMDTLAGLDGPGLTAGKTRQAHLLEYRRTLGRPTREEAAALGDFALARRAVAAQPGAAAPDALTSVFFAADTLEQALDRARDLLAAHSTAFESAVRTFAPRYEAIWRDGHTVRAFLARVASDKRRDELARFLVGVARFYGVPAEHDPPPRIVLAPVPAGFGTHAQAIGRHLLIEIRPGEGLSDEAAPIVHEVAHFLFQRIEPARLAAFEQALEGLGPATPAAARALHEALPTAIAQGVADRKFRPGSWSLDGPWYHLPEVDAYAKRLYPLVRQRLTRQQPLDEAFLRQAVALHGLIRR